MQRYSSGAILLHWLLAIALAFQLALGFAMPHGVEGFAQYQLHKSVGIAILLLSLIRLGWRIAHPAPPAIERGWQHRLAQAVHIGLYAFMILTPLTGWALVSTAEIKVPTLLFGTVPWPHLPLPDSLGGASEQAHEWLAWFGIALFVLHFAGALRHHFLLDDGLLHRMAPRGSVPILGVLALLVLGVGGATLLLAGGVRPAPPPSGEVAQDTAQLAAADVPATAPETEATDEALEADVVEEDAASEEDAVEEAAGPPPVWTIQSGGRLAFAVDNGQGGIKGSFPEWGGTIRFNPDDPSTADIRIDIDLASATVGDATQDGMLRGGEFFAADSNAKATWRSTSVSAQGGGRYRAQGTLTMKGVSRPQVLNFTLSGEGLRRRVDGTATIDRNAFSIGGTSASAIAPNVSLTFGFDAVGRAP